MLDIDIRPLGRVSARTWAARKLVDPGLSKGHELGWGRVSYGMKAEDGKRGLFNLCDDAAHLTEASGASRRVRNGRMRKEEERYLRMRAVSLSVGCFTSSLRYSAKRRPGVGWIPKSSRNGVARAVWLMSLPGSLIVTLSIGRRQEPASSLRLH